MGGVFIILRLPGFLKSGQLVTGSTSLLYKGSDGTGRSLNPDNYQPKGNYAAASHNHSAGEITSGTLSVARGGTGNTSVDTTPTSGSTKMVTSGGVYTAIDSLKTSVSNGKSAVASAITDKGVSTSATASFDTMASNIRSIKTNIYNGLRNDTLPSGYTKVNYIKLNNCALIDTKYTTPKMYYTRETTITSIPKYEWGFTVSVDQHGTNSISSDSGVYLWRSRLLSYFTNGQYTAYLSYGTRYYDMPSNQSISQKYMGDGWINGTSASVVYRLGHIINVKYTTNQYVNGQFYSDILEWINECNTGVTMTSVGSAFNMDSNITLGFGQYDLRYNPSIYGFYSKIENTDTYYANMIPCINSSGVAGLYDTVRNIFVSNATDSGTITYG